MTGAAEICMVALVVLPLTAAVIAFVFPRLAAATATLSAAGALGFAALLLRSVADSPARHAPGGWGAPLGIELHADALTAVMLVATAVILLALTVFGRGHLARQPLGRFFWPLTLMLHTALDALFLANDVFNIYVTLELLSLSAVALVALADRRAALAASLDYLLASMAASLAYLLGVAILYHATGTLDLDALGAGRGLDFDGVPARVALGLMTAGLAVKGALFPLHFWLPAAHSEAPAPVSALLSGLVVKAPFYVLLRLWLGPFAAAPGSINVLLGALAAAALVWGSVQALRQDRLKLLVAYSTVAQLGLLYLLFPLLAETYAVGAAVLLMLSHALAKAGMFLAAGNIHFSLGHDRIRGLNGLARHLPVTLSAFGVGGICVAGMPPSGNFVAKWLLIESAFDSGRWWWAVPIIAGGLLSAAYVLRVVGHAFMADESAGRGRPIAGIMAFVPLMLSLLALGLGLAAAPLLETLADLPGSTALIPETGR